MFKKTLLAAASTVALSIASMSAHAAWTLDTGNSTLSYVSIKKNVVGETNSFEAFSGSIDGSGNATIEIDLASVSTGVEIRNQRMRDIVFDIASFPDATVNAEVDLSEYESLGAGESVVSELSGTLDLKGVKGEFDVEVRVTNLGNGSVKVEPNSMVIVNATDYGLEDEVEQLREVVKLPSISTVVPVNFSFVFKK